mgnify:CR=1 FL=1
MEPILVIIIAREIPYFVINWSFPQTLEHQALLISFSEFFKNKQNEQVLGNNYKPFNQFDKLKMIKI